MLSDVFVTVIDQEVGRVVVRSTWRWDRRKEFTTRDSWVMFAIGRTRSSTTQLLGLQKPIVQLQVRSGQAKASQSIC